METFPFELVVTKPFPKSVRARYRKEARGFILEENGRNFELQVCRLGGGKKSSLEGAKCTAEVKSIFNGQSHGYYSLLINKWNINIDKYGNPTVDLDRLAVVINSGRNRQQRSERGKFYLEFKLIFADGNVGARYRTDDMLDESCTETCQPKIKSWNPRCGVAGEEVWIHCYSNVTKTKSVLAILSYMIDGHEHEDFTNCDVDGKLIKFILPSLYDKIPPAEKTELQLRIVVQDKDENITSNKVEFGYLAPKFNRPKAPQCDSDEQDQGEKFSRKRKIDGNRSCSKTFDSITMLELLSPNQCIETADTKCMSHCSISKQEYPVKAFSQYYQNPSVGEKLKLLITHSPGDEFPHEVTLGMDETCRPTEQETSNLSPDQDHLNNISTSVCEGTSNSTHITNCHTSTPNNESMDHSADSLPSASLSLPQFSCNTESNPLFEDSDYDDPSLDFSDSYFHQLQTVCTSENDTGDTSEDSADNLRVTDTNYIMRGSVKIPPDRYTAHDHNPYYETRKSEQPMKKILKMG